MWAAAYLALLGMALTGCAAPIPIVGHPPIPPIPPEQVYAPPPSPTPLIWQPGHFDWTGATYVWQPGNWVQRAGHGTLWQDGFWQPGLGGSTWVPGHWI